MRALLDEKERAVTLRRDGWAIKKIATELNVSRGSVSLWVREVVLTEKQKAQLAPRSPLRMGLYHEMAGRKRDKAQDERKRYQQEGRELAKNSSPLYLIGCMLYWGEGTKSRGSLTFTNSDPDMTRVFMRFLREACHVPEEKITMKVSGYLGNGQTKHDIEEHWVRVTGLSITQLRKGTIKKVKDSRRHVLLYGTAAVTVHGVKLLQQIYGSICEIASIDGTKWL